MTSRSNLFGMPPAQHRTISAAADARIRAYKPPAQAETWPNAPGLLPTLPGHAHGIVDREPWLIQCDGCGLREAVTTVALTTIRFAGYANTDDTRRLCADCRTRAGWEEKL